MAVSNVQYELSILKLLIDKKSPEILVKLTPEYFGNKDTSNLFRLIKGFYIDHGHFLGWDALKDELSARVRDVEKSKFLCGLVDDTRDKDTSGLTETYLVDELKKQLQFRIALAGVDKIVDGVDRKDADAVVGAMQGLYEKMFLESVSAGFSSCDMVEMTSNRVEFKYAKTGLAGIDKYGGLIESGLALVLGASGRGKTHMATQWGLHFHDNYEGSTAMFTYEQGAGELRVRILSNRSEVDLGKVTIGKYSDEELLRLRLAEVFHLCGTDEEAFEFCRRTYKLPDKDFWDNFWTTFKPQKNRFLLIDTAPNWDELLINMEMLVQTRNVKFFIIDYPTIIPRGALDAAMPSWEYALLQTGKLKAFCRRHNVRIVCPAQYDEKADNIRYASGVINFMDMAVALTEEDGDHEYGDQGAYTVKFKKYRNFLSDPTTGGTPQPFKVLKQLQIAKFMNFEF